MTKVWFLNFEIYIKLHSWLQDSTREECWAPVQAWFKLLAADNGDSLVSQIDRVTEPIAGSDNPASAPRFFASLPLDAARERSFESTEWKPFLDALRRATSITFVDAAAFGSDEMRSRVLAAVDENSSPHIVFNLVFDPSLSHEWKCANLATLLRYCCENSGGVELQRGAPEPSSGNRSFSMRTHRLLPNDFLSVWRPRLTE